jgi:hypothetical protein
LTLAEEIEKESHYIMPLRPDDEAAQIQYSYEGILSNLPLEAETTAITYASHTAGALVHSPTSALVTSIQDFTTAACANYGTMFNPPGLADLITMGLSLATGNFGDLIGWAEGEAYTCSPGAMANFDPEFLDGATAFGVTLAIPIMGQIVEMTDLDTGRLIYYIVSDSDLFIEVGQLLSPGCVLGYTLPLYYQIGTFPVPPSTGWSFSGGGAGIIWAKTQADVFEAIIGEYKNYPSSDVPCNASTFGECLNENPQFTNAGAAYWGWTFDGTADRNPAGETEGLLLDDTGNNSASQALMLNTDNQYSIKVVAHVEHANDGFTDSDIIVSLGTDSHTITLPYGGEEVETVIPLQTYTADLGGSIYTLRVELAAGETGAEVVISFICVDEDADPISPLTNCIFLNSGFDSDSSWTLGGGADSASIMEGSLTLPPYGTASQVIDLLPDTYTVESRIRTLPSGSLAPAIPSTVTTTSTATGTSAVGTVSSLDYWTAQSFTTTGGQVTQLVVGHGANTGSPTGTITWELRADNAAKPGTLLDSGTYTPTASSSNTITVTDGPSLTASTLYWLQLRSTSVQSNNVYWTWNNNNGNPYAGGNFANTTNGGSTYTPSATTDLLMSITVDPSSVATIDWELDDGGTIDSGSLTAGREWAIVTVQMVVSSAVDGATFEVNANNSGESAQVDYICLVPANQPTAPAVPDYPDVRDCNSCPLTLLGESPYDIVETLQWQECRARQIYYCDMRIILVDTRDGVLETVRGMGMLGRWLSASSVKQLTWFRSAFWYLGGLLNNVALSIQDSIAWSSGANTVIISDTPMSIFDLLGLLITGLRDVLVTTLESLVDLVSMLLGFLTPIVGTLLDVITSAVSMFTTFIESILDQIGIVHTLIASIIDGANNATPAAIEGAPSCTETPEGICWGFYVLDNTIFSGPVADLLPILAGAATLNLLVWVLGKFRDAFASLS